MRNIDGTAAIVTGYGPVMNLFAEFIHDWEEMYEKLDNHEITKEEYDEWKRTWDNGTWVKTDDAESPYTAKSIVEEV